MRSDLIIVVDNKMMVTLEMYSTFTKESIKKSEQYVMRIHSTQLDIGDEILKSDKIWDKREGYFEGIDERNIELAKNMIQEGLETLTLFLE